MRWDMIDWNDPELRTALADRDISTVFLLLIDRWEVSRHSLAERVGFHPSEVTEILKGRHVMMYDVLVRIADGLGIPRGWMGLAYYGDDPSTPVEEVDEDVERRKFLALAGSIVVGAPVLGDLTPLTVRDVITRPPERIGADDVRQYAATVARLGVLDRESGGMAARQSLAATATAGEAMLTAHATDTVQRDLRYAVSEAHRLAGWSSGDIGLVDHCRWHMHRAVEYASGDNARIAQVLCSAADMEKHHGDSNEALKILQLAQVNIKAGENAQADAVLSGLTASTYVRLGYEERARQEMHRARELFDEGQPEDSLPFFAFYGPGAGLLAAVETKLNDFDRARTDAIAALRTRPAYDVRCNALDTIVLATILINAGEFRDGVNTARRALDLVEEVGSQRVLDRLAPLQSALAGRRDSACQDLAHRIAALRTGAG